jgi:hypothetical protein
MRGRRFLLVSAVVAVAALAAGGLGYAALTPTNNVYTGCLKAGQISSVAIGSSPASMCVKPAVQISWSQQGPPGTNGTNGTNVTSAPEPAGTNCANGGSSFTSASGTTYACNGAPGAKGDTGQAGPGFSNGAGSVNIGPDGDQIDVDSYASGFGPCTFYLFNGTGGTLSGWEQVNGAVSDFSLSQFDHIQPTTSAPTLYSFRIIADFGTITLNYWVSVTGNSCASSYQYIVS